MMAINTKKKEENGNLRAAAVLQRIAELKKVLSGIVVSEHTRTRTVIYDKESERFVVMKDLNEPTFHKEFPHED